MVPTNAPDCPFCRIVAGKDPSVREVYRNQHVVAFFPTEPATLGHTLVIPQNHIPELYELDGATMKHVFGAAAQLARSIKATLRPEGLNLIQSNGEIAEQTVRHLHVHLVPRWKSDPIDTIWPPETNYPSSEKDRVWQLLRDQLAGSALED